MYFEVCLKSLISDVRQPVFSLLLSELFGHEKREALLASQRFQDGNCNYTRKEKNQERERVQCSRKENWHLGRLERCVKEK